MIDTKIINMITVAKPTWAKMCNTKEDETGRRVQDKEDWWYVEIIIWANVVWGMEDGVENNSIFGAYMDNEVDGGEIAFCEAEREFFLHYTTEKPDYMDCSDVNK